MADLSLDDLMRAAGSSLGLAQDGLLTGIAAAPTAMAIAEATLEMKVTIDAVKGEALQVSPVSGADARAGAINTAALSSVTMRFVPFGNDVPSPIGPTKATPPATGGTVPPRTTRTPVSRADAEATLRLRPDIARRLAAGETVKVETVRVDAPAGAAWIVTARDARGGAVAAAQFAAKD